MFDNNGRNIRKVTRRPGRPPLDPDDPSTTVNVRLPGREYDRLYTIAQQQRLTVPEMIRRALARDRRDDEGE